MKIPSAIGAGFGRLETGSRILRWILLPLALVFRAVAQPVILPDSRSAAAEAAARVVGGSGQSPKSIPTGSVGVPSSSSSAGGMPLFPSSLGSLSLAPYAQYRLLYGDGIQSSPGQAGTTAINELTVGLPLTFGTNWIFDYTLRQTFYSQTDLRDTFDQAVAIRGTKTKQYQAGAWTFQPSINFSASAPLNVETARQTNQKTVTSEITAVREVGRKSGLELSASYSTILAALYLYS